MKSVFSIFSQGSAWRRGIGILAAMLLLAVLVGSMAAVFALAQQSKSGTNPNQQHTAPTEAPPPSSPGTYITTEKNFGDYQVSRLNPQTRQQIWTQDVGAITSSIIVYGDTVYVTAGNPDPYAAPDNYVYALDATAGVIRWKAAVSNDTFHAPDRSGPYDLGVLSTPTIAQGTLVVGARDGKYYALDAATGARRWVYTAPATDLVSDPVTIGTQTFYNYTIVDSGPVVIDQSTVYGAIHNALFAVDAKTGKQLWATKIDSKQIFNGTVLVNGTLYLSSYEESNHSDPSIETGYIYAYASKDGKQLWRHSAGAWVLSAPTVDNGVVYFGSFNDNLYALKASDGSELWRYNTHGEIYETPIVENGFVYTDEWGNGSETAGPSTVLPALFAINASSGKQVWQKTIKNLSSLQQVLDGVIYVGVWPGQLYALSVNGGSVLWHQHYGAKLIDKTGTESEAAPLVTVID